MPSAARSTPSWFGVVAVSLAVSLACCRAVPPAVPPPPAAASQNESVEGYADRLLAEARATEPETTRLLLDLASRHGGEMLKLEHRFKTRASTLRKIRARLADASGHTLADVVIDDALRYTMRVDDQPPGHYLQTAKAVLAKLEEHGHVVRTVKNYWPKEDNYSGLNCSLNTREGVAWELQLHTTASFELQSRTRDAYEELRRVATPLNRKRELFDQVTDAWQGVPIPEQILQPGAVHPKAEIHRRPRP